MQEKNKKLQVINKKNNNN